MIAPLLGAVVGALAAVLTLKVPLPGGIFVLLYGASAGALLFALLHFLGRAVRWRRPAWRALGATLGVAALAAAHNLYAPAAPMVLLVVIDCLRADALNPDTAPNLTRLAESSWRFSEVRSHSSWTRTSMPALLSSRMPSEHGLFRTKPPDRIREDIRLISQYFSDAGYATAGIAEQAQLVPAFGYGRGFQLYDAHAGLADDLQPKAQAWNQIFRTTPRFLFLHYMDIHGPYTARKRSLAKNLPSSKLPLAPSKPWRSTIRGVRDGVISPTADDWAHMRGYYEGEIRELDVDLGRLVRRWRNDGTLANTWMVLTADHGELFGEHGGIEHVGTPWDALLRVPLLVRPPGGTAGKVLATPVLHADVLPTLLTARGLPVPPELYGRDLSPLFTGGTVPEIPGFAEERASKVQRISVWWKGWKLLREEPLPGATEREIRNAAPVLQGVHLYHVAEDPGETVNLAEAEPGRVAELDGLFAAYQVAVKEGRPLRGVDWEAAARSGARWATEGVEGLAADPSEETMKALEELGYVDDGEEE